MTGRKYKEILVLKTCATCGKIFIPNWWNEIYCHKKCRNQYNNNRMIEYYYSVKRERLQDKPERLPIDRKSRYRAIRDIAKDYMSKNFGELIYNQEMESLGTYSTSNPSHKSLEDGSIARDRNGKPDWKKEAEVIEFLKKKTYKNKKRNDYCITEGDLVRCSNKELEKHKKRR